MNTFVLAGAALLLLGVLAVSRRLATRHRLFAIRIRPQVVLLFITLWLCVVFSELGLRLFCFQSFEDTYRMAHPGADLGFRYDRTLGWFPVPNSHTTNNYYNTFSITHNSKGFRDPEPSIDSKPGVVFLGDSFVWGHNVEAVDRFTEALRSRHPGLQIYNFGVSGYSTDQEYLLLQKYFKEYHPRLVFLVFCTENDDDGNHSNTSEGRYFKPYFTVEAAGLTLRGVPVPRSERVFCVQHPILSKLYLVRLVVQTLRNPSRLPMASSSSPTDALLEALREYVSAQGAEFRVGITRSDPVIEASLRKRKIHYVDLSTDLRIPGDMHWDVKGHAFVAKKIEEFLISEKLL